MHKDFQGTGVASALVRAAETRLAGGGCGMVQIEYDYTPGHAHSEKLMSMYEEKLGFTCSSGAPRRRRRVADDDDDAEPPRSQFRRCHKKLDPRLVAENRPAHLKGIREAFTAQLAAESEDDDDEEDDDEDEDEDEEEGEKGQKENKGTASSSGGGGAPRQQPGGVDRVGRVLTLCGLATHAHLNGRRARVMHFSARHAVYTVAVEKAAAEEEDKDDEDDDQPVRKAAQAEVLLRVDPKFLEMGGAAAAAGQPAEQSTAAAAEPVS